MSIQSIARTLASFCGRESLLVRVLRPLYERALDLAYGGRGIPWEINGNAYRISPYHRTRFGHSYDPIVADFLSRRIKPGATCIDVGANVGVYVLQMARWTGKTGRVIAFEPNPAARKILCQHANWNGIESRVSVESYAISSEEGATTMFAYGADGMSRLGRPNAQIAGRTHEVRIPVTTLSNYCEARRVIPDWVVIDVEGFEIQALIGFERYLRMAERFVGIVVEMHPDVWASSGTTVELARQVFARLDRRPVALTGQSDVWSEHGHVYCAGASEG